MVVIIPKRFRKFPFPFVAISTWSHVQIDLHFFSRCRMNCHQPNISPSVIIKELWLNSQVLSYLISSIRTESVAIILWPVLSPQLGAILLLVVMARKDESHWYNHHPIWRCHYHTTELTSHRPLHLSELHKNEFDDGIIKIHFGSFDVDVLKSILLALHSLVVITEAKLLRTHAF